MKLHGGAREIGEIPCILFAFKGPTKETLINSINKYAKEKKVSLNDCSPDMVVVLGKDYYICKNDGWVFPVIPMPGGYFRDWSGLPHENLVGIYTYLINLINSYSYENRPLMINKYFNKPITNEKENS